MGWSMRRRGVEVDGMEKRTKEEGKEGRRIRRRAGKYEEEGVEVRGGWGEDERERRRWGEEERERRIWGRRRGTG